MSTKLQPLTYAAFWLMAVFYAATTMGNPAAKTKAIANASFANESVTNIAAVTNQSIGIKQYNNQLRNFAYSKPWLRLLHFPYPAKTDQGNYQSDIDDRRFFLAEDGKHNPYAELQATIAAIKKPQAPDALNQHAACQYPARTRILINAGLVTDKQPDCTDYTTFLQRWRPQTVTLIFADAYLGNPASAFGHTFLRLDPAPDENGSRQPALLNGTIDFAAFTGDAAGLNYALGGMTGQFPGRFSVLPYYIQVNEYNYGALRDLWEYPLLLTKQEINLLMAHLWELRDASFDYYFLDENCSSQLLALLETVNPNWDLLNQTGSTVIPGETVKILSQQKHSQSALPNDNTGLLGEPEFRPALDSVIRHNENDLTPQQLAIVKDFNQSQSEAALKTRLANLSAQEQAQTLDVSYDLLRLKNQNKDLTAQEFNQKGQPLLIARSKIKQRSQFSKVKTPNEQPALDHGAARIRFGANHIQPNGNSEQNNQTQALLGWRIAFHDMLDPRLSNPRGVETRAFDTLLAIKDNPQGDGYLLDLKQLDLIGLRSLSPRSDLIKPWSWQLAFGYREDNLPNHSRSHYYVDIGRGLSWSLDDDKQHLVYALAVSELAAGRSLHSGWRLNSGLQTGWLYTPNRWQTTQLEVEYRIGLAGEKTQQWHATLAHQWSFNDEWGLRARARYQSWDNLHSVPAIDATELTVTLEWYL